MGSRVSRLLRPARHPGRTHLRPLQRRIRSGRLERMLQLDTGE